jgi:ABC-type phosphate transport system permease subunit
MVVLWCLGAFKVPTSPLGVFAHSRQAYITGRAWWLGGFIMVVTGVLTTGVAVVAATFLDKYAHAAVSDRTDFCVKGH